MEFGGMRSGGSYQPFWEEEAGFTVGKDGVPEIEVIGRRSLGQTVYDLWTKVFGGVMEYFAGHGATQDYFATDSGLFIRGRISDALAHSGLSGASLERITKNILNQLLDSKNLGLLNALQRLADIPFTISLDNTINGFGATGFVISQPSGTLVGMNIRLNEASILSAEPPRDSNGVQQDGPYANNLERALLHELLHAGGQFHSTTNPYTYPGGITQFVQDGHDPSNSLYYSADGTWVQSMSTYGNSLGLMTINNGLYWYPIVVDIKNDGPDLLDKIHGVSFDVNGDGKVAKSGWVGKSDALLVADWNKNGRIENGSEVSFARFGENPKSDLVGLASFDADKNGKIDHADSIFDSLRLWQDLNSNGLTDPGELRTLEEAGILSISLNLIKTAYEVSGNLVSHETLVELAGGKVVTAYDVGFHV